MRKVDAIIIGSGQAGKPLSQKLSEAGSKTIMIEISEQELGGTCLNVGCTPTKTLIASAKVMHDIKTGKQHGISVSKINLDFATTQKRKDKIVEDSKKGLLQRTSEAKNLELVFGTASFTGENSVVVQNGKGVEQEFSAPYIFINAGCRPSIPNIKGLDTVDWYDSSRILGLSEVPEKLIVVGGGYIGLELGQMYSRFGSKVTILERSEQIMSGEDRDIAEPLQEILESEGLNFKLSASVEEVKKDQDGVLVFYQQNGKTHQISGTHLLLVTGRQSNADRLNLESSGVKLNDKGYIKVNDKLETNVKGVYALGDINGGPQFTHIAYNDYVVVNNNILRKTKDSTKDRIVPYTIFTDPQVGRVGLSETQAREKGLNYQVIKIGGERITRGIETGETQGPWKAIVDKESGKILGAAIVSTEGGEVASIIQMAMEGGITAQHLASAIFSHPTYSESINTLFTEIYK